MTTWAPARRDTLDSLAAEILHNYPRGRVLVAVDGAPGAGMKDFADDLAAAITRAGHGATRGSVEDFRLEDAVSGSVTAAERYRGTFDYAALRASLLAPFTAGPGPAGTALAEPLRLPTDAILVVDGIFLNRPELRGAWNFSVWLDDASPDDASPDESASAAAADRATHALYLAEAAPRTRATAIVNNSDREHPRRVFADSC